MDRRSTKQRRLYGMTDSRVVDQLLMLVDRQRQRMDAPSDARKLFKQLRRAVRAVHGESVKVPAKPTLYKLLQRLGLDARTCRAAGAAGAGRGQGRCRRSRDIGDDAGRAGADRLHRSGHLGARR
ncbi:hypothetical protein ACFZBE_41155 [Streptomyces sp. NPDC008061]|uniref:hypothetical protein n=1 Tax=Streptomyces sp. NPDC008061 TaxID=3364805 RepID=UPI0036DFD58C